MPQRKDTPAARAALARRRQRAAQTLHNPQLSVFETSNQAKTKTEGVAIVQGAKKSFQTKSQSKEELRSHDSFIERRTIAEQPILTTDVSLTTPQYFDNIRASEISQRQQHGRITCAVRTEAETEFSSTPSTPGEYNIETVLQDCNSVRDQLHSSVTSSNSQSIRSHQIQEENEQQAQQRHNHRLEKYERISSFGYVERTSPQPMVLDRRDLIRYESVPRSREVVLGESNQLQHNVQGQSLPVHTLNDTDYDKDINSDSLELISDEAKPITKYDQGQHQTHYDPTVSSPSTSRQFLYREDVAKSKQKRDLNDDDIAIKRYRMKTDFKSKSKKSKFIDGKSTLRIQQKSADKEQFVPNRGILPRRSVSPSRSTIQEKNLSTRRFQSQTNINSNRSLHSSQKSQPLQQPISDVTASNTSRSNLNSEKTKTMIPTSTPVSSQAYKYIADSYSTPSIRSNSIPQVKKSRLFKNSITEDVSFEMVEDGKSHKNSFVEFRRNSPSRIEDLSEYLMDSCSIAEVSLIPNTEQYQRKKSQNSVIRSLNSDDKEDVKTNMMQPSLRLSLQHERGQQWNEIDQQLDKKDHPQFSTQQSISLHRNEIKYYRASVEEIDAKHLNALPKSSKDSPKLYGSEKCVVEPLTEQSSIKRGHELTGVEGTIEKTSHGSRRCEFSDAACLHSGNLVMLRSCSMYATLQKNSNGVVSKFSGPCLGKSEELLTLVKIKDLDFSCLMYGDVVLLQSSTKRAKYFLGSRSLNNAGGNHEVRFFEDGDTESNQWTIYPAMSGKDILVGRAAVTGKHRMDNNDLPIRSGNSILLVNCYNGGLLSVRDGELVLLTDSYSPNMTSYSHNYSLLGRLECHNRFEPKVSETFQLLKAYIPPCPTWITRNGIRERLFLTGSYLSEPLRNPTKSNIVDINLNLRAIENILVDEVIGSFLGLEGSYIKLEESEEFSTTFQLFDGIGITFDLSLRNLVEQILPLSSSYVCVRNFIDLHYPGYEYGRVMQAFCEGLNSFLQQFVSFVARLEQRIRKRSTEALTMKNIHFEITHLLHSMSILQHTTKTVFDKKGGALINSLRALDKKVYMGDTVAKDILGTLLHQSSVPYMEMLSIWLQSGRLDDPYEEFMIKKTNVARSGVELDGDTWAGLFQMNEEHMIDEMFRDEKIKNKILLTGKYWNATKSCSAQIMSSLETKTRSTELKKFQLKTDFSEILAFVNCMHDNASENLMNTLKNTFELKKALTIMKRYFLLDQGDFLMNFLEATAEELARPTDEVSISRVQYFLGISIQFTESQMEDYIDQRTCFEAKNKYKLSPTTLRCRMSELSLISHLDSLYNEIECGGPNVSSRKNDESLKQVTTGFDFFEMDFSHVPFPVSLIISPTSMENYKLLFRHLFFAKHVERRLVGVWCDHQVLRKLHSLRSLLGPTFLLRQRMIHCVQNLINYMTFEVIESNWLEMLSLIDVPDHMITNQKQQTVDDLLNIHDGFLRKTIDLCLLSNPVLIKTLMKLLNTCLLFSDQMKRFMKTTRIHDDQLNIAAEKRGALQRNLNERVASQSITRDKKKLRQSLLLVKEERDILLQRQTRRVGREICSDSYKRMVCRFEEVFSADLSTFMTKLNGHTSSGVVANLGIRLDWNGYVTNKIALP